MKRLRWLLRVGINPTARHDLRFWMILRRTQEVVTVVEYARRIVKQVRDRAKP